MTGAGAAVSSAPAAPAHPGRQRVAGANRHDVTVIGAAVDRAARLERLCPERGLHLLPSDGFAGLCAATHHRVLEDRLPGIGSRVEAVAASERA